MSSIAIHRLDDQIHRQLARLVAETERRRERVAHMRPARVVAAVVDFAARATFYLYRNHRYLSFRKLANMALINLQCRLRTERVIGMPYSMKIEPTNICNTQCQLCPTGIGLKGREKGKMDYERFTRLVDRMRPTLLDLDLSMWGDPLIVPDIFRMIRYAHDRGVWTYISSNLHAFKIGPRRDGTDQAEQLVRSGLDLMTCSLHGATQETFATYQPGKRLDEAIEKIRHIVATRDRLGRRTPQIQLNFVVTRYNEHEREAFAAMARDLGCKAVFSTPALNTRFLDRDENLVPLQLNGKSLEEKTKSHIRRWLPKDKSHVLPVYEQMLEGRFDPSDYNGRKAYPCAWPWKQAVINWDGGVSTCCGSFEDKEDMGNVFETDFKRVWNGPKYRHARRSFRKPVSAQQAAGNPCATCPGFMV